MGNLYMDKIKQLLIDSFGYIIIALVCVSYISTSLFIIDSTGKTVGQIVADTGISLIMGITIYRLFSIQGIMDAKKDEVMKSVFARHEEVAISVNKHLEELDDWCEKKNAENLKAERTRLLSRVALKYSKCFDEEGFPLDVDFGEVENQKQSFSKRFSNFKKKLYLERACNLKLSILTSANLTGNSSKTNNRYDFGRNINEYENQSTFIDLICRLIISFIFGYYGIKLVSDFNYIEFLWKIFQVLVFSSAGAIRMYNAKMFIHGEYRDSILKKIYTLEAFKNDIKFVEDPSYNFVQPKIEELKQTQEIQEQPIEEKITPLGDNNDGRQ